MQSRKAGIVAAVVGLALAVALFVVLSGGEETQDDAASTQAAPAAEEPAPQDRPARDRPPEPPRIVIRGGEPEGGAAELEFESGARALFEVDADAADELHLHGYDLYVDVGPGKPTEVSFDAEIEGVFELESHSSGVKMAEISITPS